MYVCMYVCIYRYGLHKYTNSNNTLFSATNCSILSCGENEECLQVNNIFQCVCKDDYEGPNCEQGKAINIFSVKEASILCNIKSH